MPALLAPPPCCIADGKGNEGEPMATSSGSGGSGESTRREEARRDGRGYVNMRECNAESKRTVRMAVAVQAAC